MAAQAATAHDRAGDRRRLLESAACANRLAAACGGAATSALRAAASTHGPGAEDRTWSPAGPTNRQIADRLTVSVRAVEGHLYRACAKPEVTDRESLAAFLSGRVSY